MVDFNLFDDGCISEKNGYSLYQSDASENDKIFSYVVYDPHGNIIPGGKFYSADNARELDSIDLYTSYPYRKFIDLIISSDNKSDMDLYSDDSSLYSDYDDFNSEGNFKRSYSSYTPPKKTAGFLNVLNHSDTLVIHCYDPSTIMLSQVYENKGWDVLRDGNIDKDELHQLLENHSRIIMLGHGTPAGLMNIQCGGYVIDNSDAQYLKGKKIFAIWCYASEYAKRNNLHGLWTGNAPSEVWECAAVGYHVSVSYILENITYWSKCMADVVDMALEGRGKEAVLKAQAAYQEKYGPGSGDWTPDELGVTEYNTKTIQFL